MIKFGPSGHCETFIAAGGKSTVQLPKWLHQVGLTCFEYSFGRGFSLSDKTCVEIGEEAKKYNIEISVHAPFYINFAASDEVIVEKSYNFVLNSLKKLRLLGGRRVVVHAASQGKLTREEAMELTKKRLLVLKEKLTEHGFEDMLICLETMGKPSQIGSYEEIAELCKLSKNFIPTADFGHINSCSCGGLKEYEDFEKVIKHFNKHIGKEKTKIMHVHFSKIEYGPKGEIRHLNYDDMVYGPEFDYFAKVIKVYQLEPVIICESRSLMAHDALIMKNIYKNTK